MPDEQFKIEIVSVLGGTGFADARKATADITDSTRELTKANEDAGDASKTLEDKMQNVPPKVAEEGFKGLNLRGREMREIFAKLNEIVPGLGIALHGLGEVSEEAGASVAAAEGEVAVASKSMVASNAGLFAVILAIQATMEYWDLYKEKMEEVAKSTAEHFDKIRKATSEALEEQNKFAEAMEKASKPEDEFATALGNANQLIDAQTEAKRKLLKADEAAELSQAKTPEEREAIHKRYGDKENDLASGEEAQKIAALQKTISDLQADKSAAKGEKKNYTDEIQRLIKLAGQARAQGDEKRSDELLGEIPRMNEKIAALDKRIEKDQTDITRYSGESNIAGHT